MNAPDVERFSDFFGGKPIFTAKCVQAFIADIQIRGDIYRLLFSAVIHF